MSRRICRKEKEIAVLQEKISNINDKIEDIHTSLMGNHKKGLLAEFSEWKGAIRFIQWVGGIVVGILTACIGILFKRVL